MKTTEPFIVEFIMEQLWNGIIVSFVYSIETVADTLFEPTYIEFGNSMF